MVRRRQLKIPTEFFFVLHWHGHLHARAENVDRVNIMEHSSFRLHLQVGEWSEGRVSA